MRPPNQEAADSSSLCASSDDGIVVGEDARAVGSLPDGQVGEVEGMVGDHKLRAPGTLAGGFGEARADVRAPPSGAAVGPDRELGPEARAGLEGKLGAVARRGRLDPGAQALVPVGVLGAPKKAAKLVDPVQAFAAKVVLAPLDDGHANIAAEGRGGGRYVLRQQLLLERLRGRSDHDALAGGKRREQVREAFPGAGAGLGEQRLAGLEGLRNGLGQGSLLGPGLEPGERGRQAAGGTEELLHRDPRA
jgi:hypothetical protein